MRLPPPPLPAHRSRPMIVEQTSLSSDLPLTLEVVVETQEELAGLYARLIFDDHEELSKTLSWTGSLPDFDLDECEEFSEALDNFVAIYVSELH